MYAAVGGHVDIISALLEATGKLVVMTVSQEEYRD